MLHVRAELPCPHSDCHHAQGLEGGLQARPAAHLREPLLLNLCSMYELSSSSASAESKRRLSAWAARFAPDDFDLTCTRAG